MKHHSHCHCHVVAFDATTSQGVVAWCSSIINNFENANFINIGDDRDNIWQRNNASDVLGKVEKLGRLVAFHLGLEMGCNPAAEGSVWGAPVAYPLTSDRKFVPVA